MSDEHDERRPLLDRSASPSSLESCGTAVEDTATITPLPWRALTTLLWMNALGPLAYELIFPFINQMLVELRIVTDLERVGFYSGILESAFSLMSLITILPMSLASDRVGRKPVILVGVSGLAVSLVAFGMSRTFLTLIISRCLAGALGGVSAAVRIMIGELTDRSNQALAFNALALTYRLGQIIGLPLGGFLAHPERHVPSIFNTPFWLYYPFLLPCLAGAAFAVMGVFFAALFITETGSTCRPSPRIKIVEELHDVIGASTREAQTIDDELQFSGSESTIAADSDYDDVPPPIMDLLRNSQVYALIVSNLGMCTTSELLFNIYPLFAYTPVHLGGLGLSEAEIGLHLAARSMIHVLALICFNPFYRWIGRTSAVRVYQCSMIFWPFVCAFYPVLNWIARGNEADGQGKESWLFYCVTGCWFLIWSIAGYCWTCIGMLATDASPSAAALAGINGIIQMSLTLPQVITPAFSNSVFAYSIAHPEILGGRLVWAVLFCFACMSSVHSLFLKEATDDWRAKSPPRTPSPSTPCRSSYIDENYVDHDRHVT